MTTILHILQAIGLYFLLDKIPFYLWSIFTITLIIMYFMGKTYYTATNDGSDAEVVRFWYQVRSWVFIADILIVVGMYAFIFIK